MAICPKCNEEAIPTWKKLVLSPLVEVPCEHCGVELGITWKSYFLAISIGSLVFLAAYFLMEEGLLQYIVYGVAIILMLLGQMFFMPFDIREQPQELKE